MFEKVKKMKTQHQAIFAVLIAFAVVCFWRGVWGLLDEYLLPNNYQASLWISLIVGFLILWVTHQVTTELM